MDWIRGYQDLDVEVNVAKPERDTATEKSGGRRVEEQRENLKAGMM